MQFAMKYLLVAMLEHKLSVNLVAVPDADHRAQEGYLMILLH